MGVTNLVFEKNPLQKHYVLPLFTIDFYGKIKINRTKTLIFKKRLYFFLSFSHMFWSLYSCLKKRNKIIWTPTYFNILSKKLAFFKAMTSALSTVRFGPCAVRSNAHGLMREYKNDARVRSRYIKAQDTVRQKVR